MSFRVSAKSKSASTRDLILTIPTYRRQNRHPKPKPKRKLSRTPTQRPLTASPFLTLHRHRHLRIYIRHNIARTIHQVQVLYHPLIILSPMWLTPRMRHHLPTTTATRTLVTSIIALHKTLPRPPLVLRLPLTRRSGLH